MLNAGYSGQKPKVGDLASKQVLEACFGLESPFKLRFLDFGTGYDDPTETGFTPPRNNSFFMCVGSMVQSFFFQGLTKKERQFRANEIRGQHRQSLVILSMVPSTNGVWKDEGFVRHVIDAWKDSGDGTPLPYCVIEGSRHHVNPQRSAKHYALHRDNEGKGVGPLDLVVVATFILLFPS